MTKDERKFNEFADALLDVVYAAEELRKLLPPDEKLTFEQKLAVSSIERAKALLKRQF